ncbi:MAG TPA: pitrilysin family protein [Longimicrobiales bacterium]|nr:pitrilysin family protein [Longimicrobiales bacterium]
MATRPASALRATSNVRRGMLAATLAITAALPATLAPPAAAQQAASALEPIATVEGITEYRLDNGLRVLLFPDPSKPQITVNITYLVGSRHEGYGETGMAHLLEHLLFRGSTNHPDIDQELNERGAQPNGTTWYDRTNYFEIFPASEDNLEWALDLEADRMVNSFVRAEDLAAEMTVVRNEMESGENDPYRILVARTLSTAYLWHNYGKSTIGARSDVENVPIDRLRAFYEKYYQPDNAVLIVAGNFDADLALDVIVEKFGSIPRPERTGSDILYATYTDEPTQDGERMVTLRRVGELQYATTLYHVPPGSHPEYAAVDVLSYILGDSPSGRLYKALVETRLATRASAQAYQLREASPLLLSATVERQGDLQEVLSTMNEVVEDVASGEAPITEEEVQRAKTSLLTRIAQSFNSSAGIALQLSEWAAMGDWRLFFLHRDRIEAVGAEDVSRVASAYLKPSNRTVGLFYPTADADRAEIPDAPDVTAMVEGYQGREAVAEGEAFDPSPTNVESRTTRYTLPNGMQVALLPKQTRGDLAMVRLRLSFGNEEALMGRGTAAELAGSLLMRGTERRTRQELEDELDRLQASGSVSGGAIIGTGQFQTVHNSVEQVIRLMAEIVREPSFPESEFALVKEQSLASIAQARTEPDALASIALARHMSDWPPGHPNYTETFDEAEALIQATTLEDVRAFHADFYGPQQGNIVVVGDFDEAEVRRVIEESFGSWESPHPFRRVASPFYEPPAERLEIETPDKANAYFFAQQNLRMSDTHADYPALLMGGYILGGGVLNSRLARRIRTQEGLSYGVAASISGHPVDPLGQLFAYAIYAPENAEALETAFVEEVERALRDGFTEEELRTAKQGWLEGRQLSRAQDSSLASTLSQGLYFDRTLIHDAELEERVASLTLAEVNRAFRTWIDLSQMTWVKAGDFGGSE